MVLTLGRMPVVPVFTGSENLSFSVTAETGSACNTCTYPLSDMSYARPLTLWHVAVHALRRRTFFAGAGAAFLATEAAALTGAGLAASFGCGLYTSLLLVASPRLGALSTFTPAWTMLDWVQDTLPSVSDCAHPTRQIASIVLAMQQKC